MKGLIEIPSLKKLEKAIERLQFKAPTQLKLSELALFTQWARFDARLAEVVVKYIFNHWEVLNAFKFRQELCKQPWPNSAAVLLENAELLIKLKTPSLRQSFKYWKLLAVSDFKKANFELFFIGQYQAGGKLMFKEALLASKPYLKWGYLGRDLLINKAPSSLSQISKMGRLEILKNVAQGQPRISFAQYFLALEKSISKRQAERDLLNCGFLKPMGRTKGRYYRVLKVP